MKGEEKKQVCTICRQEFPTIEEAPSEFAEAGAWLAGEVWKDAGELCPCCLENRGRLAMMYFHEMNS